MERTVLFPHLKFQSRKEGGQTDSNSTAVSRYGALAIIIMCFIAFMLGRVVVLSKFAPLGLCFYASLSGERLHKKNLLVVAAAMLGLLTVVHELSIVKYIVAIIVFMAISYLDKKRLLVNTYTSALTASLCIISVGAISYIRGGFLLYDLLVLLFEGFIVFIAVVILSVGLPAFEENYDRKILSNEEVISLSILIGLVIMGFTGVNLPFGLSLKSILSIFIILIFSLKMGAGFSSASGIALGLINSMVLSGNPLLIGTYGFCALLSGIFKPFGRIGVALAFILGNAIITAFFNASTEVLINIYDILIAIVVFCFIPGALIKITDKVFNTSFNTMKENEMYSIKIKDIMLQRLYNVSASFEQLARVFSDIAEKKKVMNKNDVAVIFDQVAEKVCKDCGLCLVCWEREFHNTYQVMFGLLKKLENKGWVDEKDIPPYFSNRCVRPDTLVEAINYEYEIYKVNLMWQNKVKDSRNLISQQLQSLSGIISKITKEVATDFNFNSELEREILVAFDRNAIKIRNVSVLENSKGKYEVDIVFKPCDGNNKCMTESVELISEIIGRRMTKGSKLCTRKNREAVCKVRYIEEEIYSVSMGVARIKKDGQNECGDNYSFMQLDNGKYVLALSDGMGSGSKAARESSSALALLEQFLEAGFDEDTAVKIINSVLVLKSPEETFTTIDLCIIDLYTGSVEFVKIGGAATFIKRKDKVDVIKSTSLPVGILNNVDFELSNKIIKDGNFIIMMTDGLLDSKSDTVQKENWIKQKLMKINSTNSQQIADYLIRMGIKNYNNKIADDMTVLVAKVWKKV